MAKSIARNLADVASPTGVLDGTLSTAAQTNITSLGTLSSLVIADGGNIGSASDTDAISISSGGVVTMNQIPVLSAGLNVSGGSIAGTLSTAAQGNITSLGTLTALTVDNLGINGNTITANSGALNLTPASGSAIVLDGTINVDAGVVTGATSITSTAFVGGLTGNVTGNVSGTAATVTGAAQGNITSLGTLSSLAVTGTVTGGNATFSNLTVSATEKIRLDGAGGHTFIQESSNDTIVFATGGSARLTLDANATFSGAVTMPSGILTVGDIKAVGTGGLALQTDEGTKRLFINDDGKVGISAGGLIYASRFSVGLPANHTPGTVFTTSPSSFFSEAALGGTTGNSQKIAIFGGSDATNVSGLALYRYRRATGTNWTTDGFSLRQEVDGTASIYDYINFAGGKVGIGTNNPGAQLQIYNAAAGNLPLLRTMSHATAAGSFDGNYSVEFRHATSTVTHAMLVTNVEADDSRRTLDVADSNGVFASFVNGKVGIGTTNPGVANLEVVGTGTDAYTPTAFLDKQQVRIKHDNTTNNYGGIGISNSAGNYEWFIGTHQIASNQADFVIQGADPRSTYTENMRMTTLGIVSIPLQARMIRTRSAAGNQTIANSTTTNVDWNGNESTIGINYTSSGGSTGEFTIVTAGVYLINAYARFQTTSTGFNSFLSLHHKPSGGSFSELAYDYVAGSRPYHQMNINRAKVCAAGDTMKVVIWHNQGGDLPMTGNGSSSAISVTKVA